ncbi:MAG TPA: glycosyltransferase [Streptosporangiaceae bacterium]|jgi:sterol 3beta-glucosyltransferase
MRILILTHGTRGDVQPYAGLAWALRAAGHDALLAGPAGLASVAEPYGIPYAPLDDGPNTLMDAPEIRAAVETNYRGLRGKAIAMTVVRRTRPLLARVLEDMAAAADGGFGGSGPDLVVHHAGMPGQHIAEKFGVPAVPACLQPVWVPTGSFPNPMLPVRLPRALNRASYLSIRLTVRTMAGVTDRWRTGTLGLPRRRGRHDILHAPDGAATTVLQAFSRHVLPAPLDYPPTVHTTGFWHLPAPPGWTPPPDLAAFLAAGPPPIYLGFGSMAGTDPGRIGRIAAEAVRRAGVRAVVATGWGGIDAAAFPDGVHVLDQAPHAWLFPRMAAIVHHGGSGTTAAALASGRPQVVCPFVADQPFWARRTHAAGVAPEPRPQCHLTPDGLAGAIRQVRTDDVMRRRATELGERIRAEDGAATAVRVLEQILDGAGRTPSR